MIQLIHISHLIQLNTLDDYPSSFTLEPKLMGTPKLIMDMILLLHPAKSGIASFQSKQPIRPHNARHTISPSEKQGFTGKNMMGLCGITEVQLPLGVKRDSESLRSRYFRFTDLPGECNSPLLIHPAQYLYCLKQSDHQ